MPWRNNFHSLHINHLFWHKKKGSFHTDLKFCFNTTFPNTLEHSSLFILITLTIKMMHHFNKYTLCNSKNRYAQTNPSASPVSCTSFHQYFFKDRIRLRSIPFPETSPKTESLWRRPWIPSASAWRRTRRRLRIGEANLPVGLKTTESTHLSHSYVTLCNTDFKYATDPLMTYFLMTECQF